MSNEPIITIVGNACGDAELRYTASGVAVCGWTVAVTPRVKRNGEWTDGEPTYYRCTAWERLAEPCAETITKGMRLLVQGRLTTRTFETREGEKRLSVELAVDAVGPDLRYATAKVQKLERRSQSSAHGRSGTSSSAPADDPWSSVPPADAPMDSEPPF